MTNEEKQALIEAALRIKRARNIYGSDITDVKALCEIALAALTAQPVKLPAPYGMQDHDKWLKQSEVESAIRAAGYEVAD